MHIESVAISNYKSFLERQVFNFEPGFNLLVGTNNAGKTTVLDVIDLELGMNDPHRSERTVPVYGNPTSQLSECEVALFTRFGELRRILGGTQIFLPLTSLSNPNITDTEQLIYVKRFAKEDRQLHIRSVFGAGRERLYIQGDELVSASRNRQDPNSAMPAALFQYVPDKIEPQIDLGNYGGNGSTVINYGQIYKNRIYRFSAQRRPGFQCSAQGTAVLDREAVNLPYCVNHLQTNDAHGHKTLCEWIARVFPSVKWVQAPPANGQFEMRCLPHRPEARRDDLAIPLSKMGAGIGNVIAMFYVVLTSRDPQVIAIDEPNAFLHPRALRELLAILEAEGKQHQFILTAHSPDVLTAVNTRTISLLDFDGVATTVKQVGPKDLHQLRGGLADLGIRMTDLHAKDRVLWVEGQTEEIAMPQLLRWACPEVAAGTSVLRVEQTGTFSKKGIPPGEVVKIYERLSASWALVPPLVCILLDGEMRKQEEREAMETASQGKLRFLGRRMLENYLLHPSAIAAIISEMGQDATEDSARKILDPGSKAIDVTEVDGASVLKKIFSELSQAKLEYRKTRDAPALVTWLLEHEPDHLVPLRTFLRGIFQLKPL